VEEKEEERYEEKDLIELRIVEEMVPKRFHKYLKVFEKKESERMLIRKTWNHAIDLREGFVLKRRKIYPLSRVEREEVHEFVKNQLRKGVKIVDDGLNFYFHFLFYFLFFFSFLFFSFLFLFLEQLGLGVISHAVTSVTT